MVALDVSRRAKEPELMDSETVSYEDFRACLRDLRRANQLTLGYRPTLDFLDELRRSGRWPESRPVRILDAGSGYGDTLRKVARWAAQHRLDVQLLGVDNNPWSTRSAREAEAPALPIEWITDDIFAYTARAEPVDVVLSALFTHHLDDAGVVEFLRWMERSSTLGWFVNDLHRARVPHVFFAGLARLARWHRFVRHDGPLSIARAFTADDWRGFLHTADVEREQARVQWYFPYRLCVARIRTATDPRAATAPMESV